MLDRINTFRWQSITETLLNALKRFPVAATATIGLCISLLLLVNLPYEQVKGSILYEPSYWYVWVGALPLAASIALCFENRLSPTIRHSVSLLAVLLWSLYGYISNDTPEHFFGALAFIAPIVTFFSSLFWAAFLKKDTDTSFWNFSYLLCIQILTGLLLHRSWQPASLWRYFLPILCSAVNSKARCIQTYMYFAIPCSFLSIC